jgi:chromosome segregation ATPase
MPAAERENNRTHEPSLRELTAELDGLREVVRSQKEHVLAIIDERDRRYEDRFKAMDEKTGLALTSSEKAFTKAETATEKRFDAVNEFRGSLKDQADRMMPRAEADGRFGGVEDKIDEIKKEVNSLRENRSEMTGVKVTTLEGRQQNNWMIGTVLGALAVVISAAAFFLHAK